MSSLKPRTLGGLRQVSGIGARKLEAYGQAFVDAIRAFD
jgi:ATP-dependent DNA helicase RecQ